VRVDLLHFKVCWNLIKVLMPDTEAVLGSCNHCLGVVTRSEARVNADAGNLLTELWIRSQCVKLLLRRGNKQHLFRAGDLAKLV
jgi:hypothetical protein